jgi:hypothetical protein
MGDEPRGNDPATKHLRARWNVERFIGLSSGCL